MLQFSRFLNSKLKNTLRNISQINTLRSGLIAYRRKSAARDHLTRHTLSPPQKKLCLQSTAWSLHTQMKGAPTSRVSTQVSEQTHEKNFPCITETTFKPSPPNGGPAAASQPRPGPCWNTLPIPRGQAASRGEFTCPSLTKEWNYGCKIAPPFLQPLLPDSRLPEHPLPGWGPLVLPRQLPPPERARAPCAGRPRGMRGCGDIACEAAAAAVPLWVSARPAAGAAGGEREERALTDPGRHARLPPLAEPLRRQRCPRSRPPHPCAPFSLLTSRTHARTAPHLWFWRLCLKPGKASLPIARGEGQSRQNDVSSAP